VPNFANVPRLSPRHIPERNGVRVPRIDQMADKESAWIFEKEFESMFFRLKKTLKLQKGQVLLITSPAPEDGKSVTSLNLALTMARMGHHTILMDADTIRGRVQQNLRSSNHFQAEEFLPDNDEGPRVIDWNQGTSR